MLPILLAALESDADRAKFIKMYEQCHEQVEKAAMRILKNQYDAEDAVQNAFMQVIKHFGKACEISCKDLPFWMICIVKNEAFMILRAKKRVVSLEDWDGAISEADDVTNYNELISLFSKLPVTYKSALEMKFLLDYSGKEIAHRLGISESAVNTRISRGRTMLKEIVEKEGFHI